MNLQYIRYALEIARTGSISKAAENLSVAQPNLSRAVKELESSLSIAIFERTRTGMTVTPEGEKLLSSGERILREVEELETMFEGDATSRETLSLCFPHAAYIADALASFSRDLPTDTCFDLYFKEVGLQDAPLAVASGESRLGILRIPAHNEAYYTARLADRELAAVKIAALPTVVLTRATLPSPVSRGDLAELTAVCQKDMPQDTGNAIPRRRITADTPTALHTLLASDPALYALSLPVPTAALADGMKQYPLAEADIAATSEWLDLLIYPKFYQLSALDRRLLTLLQKAASECVAK